MIKFILIPFFLFLVMPYSVWKSLSTQFGIGAVGSIDSHYNESLWTWDGSAGEMVEVEITIDDSIYPNKNGVTFFVKPVDGIPAFKRNDQFRGPYLDRDDIRGPRVGDHFHATARNTLSGDSYQATWTDINDKEHTTVYLIK